MFPIRPGGADPSSNDSQTAGLDANQLRDLEMRYRQGVRDLNALADELQADPEDIRPHLERLNSGEQPSSLEQLPYPNPGGNTQRTVPARPSSPGGTVYERDSRLDLKNGKWAAASIDKDGKRDGEKFLLSTRPNGYSFPGVGTHMTDDTVQGLHQLLEGLTGRITHASQALNKGLTYLSLIERRALNNREQQAESSAQSLGLPRANNYYRSEDPTRLPGFKTITGPGGTEYQTDSRLDMKSGVSVFASAGKDGKRDGKSFLLSTRSKPYEFPGSGKKLSDDTMKGLDQIIDRETGISGSDSGASEALGQKLKYLGNYRYRKRGREATSDESTSAAKRLKREVTPLAVPPFRPIYEEHQLDASRTEFRLQIGEFCDLTSDQSQWEPRFDANNAVIVHHPMEPNPRMDHVFPLRDGADPVNRVDSHYADANGQVHRNVQLQAVQPGLNVNQFTSRVNTALQQSGSMPMSRNEINAAIAALSADIHSEMTRLIENSKAAGERPPHPPPRSEPRRLERNDVEDHETLLIGHYGLVALEPSNPADVPTLRNGRMLGIYMGAVIRGETQEAQAASTHPGYQRYLQDAASSRGSGSRVNTYSADGCANSTGFANTALLPPDESAGPAYDTARINALFLPFEIRLGDRTEVIAVLVGLDNLFGPNNPGRHVLVNYGDGFLGQFAAPSAREQRIQRRTQPVKSETAKPVLPAAARRVAAGQVTGTRASSSSAPPVAQPPTGGGPNQWAQTRGYENFAHYVVETALRPLVDERLITPEDISMLRTRLEQRVAQNPGTRADHVIQEALREYWQNASDAHKNIYDRLIRAARGTQGG